MASTIAFGSYIAGTSPVHVLNTQVKIFLACVFSVTVFLVDTWWGMGVQVACVCIAYAIAHVPLTKAASGIKPVLFILIFTIIVHAFTNSIGVQAIATVQQTGSLGLEKYLVIHGSFGITLDGLFCGFYFALRIALLVAACSLLTFTSSLVSITDALQSILAPLRKIKVPVDDVAMMVSIALRFIPTTAQEVQSIANAQKSRLADFDNGNIFKRIKAWVPVFIPLFVRLFRRADELAEAMDARCYGAHRRTRMRDTSVHAKDILAFCLCTAVLVLTAVFL